MEKKKDSWSGRLAIIGATVVVGSLGIVVQLRSGTMQEKDDAYRRKEEALIRQVEEEESRALELEEERIYVQTKQYIEEVAKQKLGLVMPGEILLKPSKQ